MSIIILVLAESLGVLLLPAVMNRNIHHLETNEAADKRIILDWCSHQPPGNIMPEASVA